MKSKNYGVKAKNAITGNTNTPKKRNTENGIYHPKEEELSIKI